MLQRRQQRETVRAKSTPALEAYRLVTTLAGVAVIVIVDVKSNRLAKHVFGIRQTDGLERAFGSIRCHSGERT
jgi:hypothetical protein